MQGRALLGFRHCYGQRSYLPQEASVQESGFGLCQYLALQQARPACPRAEPLLLQHKQGTRNTTPMLPNTFILTQSRHTGEVRSALPSLQGYRDPRVGLVLGAHCPRMWEWAVLHSPLLHQGTAPGAVVPHGAGAGARLCARSS